MKNVKQFGIILAVAFVGEVMRYFIPLPIPASIYGLVIMLVLLETGGVKIGQVREAGGFLIEIMPMMFIPAAVGLLISWGALKDIFLPVIFITIVSTIVVMAVTGKMTQFIIRREKREDK